VKSPSIPIPGTRKVARLDENLAAASVELTPNDLNEIDSATKHCQYKVPAELGQYG
jgi:aryl-alcohol dehydrogenase-like predicted oxidoreductase